MPKPEQPLRVIDEEFNKWAIYRELEFLHARINGGLIIFLDALKQSLPEATWKEISENRELAASLGDGKIPIDLKSNYAAGDLDTEAEIIAAVNATNYRINIMASMLNLLLSNAKLVKPDNQRQ